MAGESSRMSGRSVQTEIHLREAINNLMLSDVLITYGDVANPIDLAPYMVRQQYIDFLNREPDEPAVIFGPIKSRLVALILIAWK